MTRSPEALTAERGTTHGDYPTMSKCVMDIMRVYEAALNWEALPDTVQVFLFNNAQKCARILTGNPYERDHYDDIAGYAHLAAKSVAPEPDLPAQDEPAPPNEPTLDPGVMLFGGAIDATKFNLPNVTIVNGLDGPVLLYPDGTTRPIDLGGSTNSPLSRADATVSGSAVLPAQTLETMGTTQGSSRRVTTTQATLGASGTAPGAPGAPAETAPTSEEGDAGLTRIFPTDDGSRGAKL